MRVDDRWQIVDVSTIDPVERAQMLARRQVEFGALQPAIAGRLATSASMVAQLAQSPAQRGVALRGERDRLIGWLSGNATGRFGYAAAVHHALAPGIPDPTAVYGALYARLGSEWRDADVTVHDVEVPAMPAIEEAWFNLGFGRRTCFAVRSSHERLDAPTVSLSVRRADEGDLAVIARLALVEAEFRNAPPVFAQQSELRLEEFRTAHAALMAAGAIHFIARLDGEDVGLLTLESHSPAPLLTPEEAPFIGPTAVAPSARGSGVGRGLVAAAVDLCRQEGSAWIGVSFNTANLLSRPFWRGCGFRPTGWKLARRLAGS